MFRVMNESDGGTSETDDPTLQESILCEGIRQWV